MSSGKDISKLELDQNDPFDPRFPHLFALYIESSRSWGWLNSLLRCIPSFSDNPLDVAAVSY